MPFSKICIILSLVFFMAAGIISFMDHATVLTLVCVGLFFNSLSKLP